MFQGFPEETIRFFLDLKFHNEVPWFHAHRPEYEAYIRKPFAEFIEEMAPVMQGIAPDMEIRPGKCLARINRDIRYTRDKSPYRDHLWLLFRRAGEPREESVMYWFELSPHGANWGVGFWGANKPAMDRLREKMLLYPSEVLKALKDSGIPCRDLIVSGDLNRRMKVPEELPAPLRSLYPLKAIYVSREAVPLSLCYSPELIPAVTGDFLRLSPIYHLLRQCADEGRE